MTAEWSASSTEHVWPWWE